MTNKTTTQYKHPCPKCKMEVPLFIDCRCPDCGSNVDMVKDLQKENKRLLDLSGGTMQFINVTKEYMSESFEKRIFRYPVALGDEFNLAAKDRWKPMHIVSEDKAWLVIFERDKGEG